MKQCQRDWKVQSTWKISGNYQCKVDDCNSEWIIVMAGARMATTDAWYFYFSALYRGHLFNQMSMDNHKYNGFFTLSESSVSWMDATDASYYGRLISEPCVRWYWNKVAVVFCLPKMTMTFRNFNWQLLRSLLSHFWVHLSYWMPTWVRLGWWRWRALVHHKVSTADVSLQ